MKQSCICHGSGASLRDATGGNDPKSSNDRGSSSSSSNNRFGEQTWLPQQIQLHSSSSSDRKWQQLRTEMNERVMAESTCWAASTQHCRKWQQNQLFSTPNQRARSKKLGRHQWQGIISTFHVGPALTDASVMRRNRNDARQRWEHRQVRQQHACSGLFRWGC